MSVLQKGLAFTPNPAKPPTLDLVVAVESGARQLGLQSDAASGLRSSAAKIMARPTILPPNITQNERAAIKQLKEDNTISVHPADKGRATSSWTKWITIKKWKSSLAIPPPTRS